MKALAPYLICLSGVIGFSVWAPVAQAAQGQDFPDTTCTCKGCGTNKTDVTGSCPSVCKDKTVYDKGSEPTDYCKAKAARWWQTFNIFNRDRLATPVRDATPDR